MDPIFNFLKLGLDGASERQKALANNIANVDTPNYKRKDVNFIETLQGVVHNNNKLPLKTTHKNHLTGTYRSNRPFKQVIMNNTKFRNDGNNVDIDTEMAELAKNNIYYNTLVQQINTRFKMLEDTISKGGK